jgi:PAS domain S-box-containing protein
MNVQRQYQREDGERPSEPVCVLLVDDDVSFLEMATEALERAHDGLQVTGEPSAESALSRLDEGDIDCVVSDYWMPSMDGIEFFDEVQASHSDIPFILLTAEGSEEIAAEAISAGVTDYFRKSGDADQYTVLANRITNVVQQHQAKKRAAEQERISSLVRTINKALAEATTREAIEAEVCEIIAQSNPYVFAWIGEPDPETGKVQPRVSAGLEESYLEEILVTSRDSPTGQGPTGTAIRTEEIQIVQNIEEEPDYEPWREDARERGYQSSAAVPLVLGETHYGTLNIYSDRPYAFDQPEQDVLSELGDTIARAIERTESRRDLHTFREAVEQAGHAIYWTDRDETIQYVNPAFEDQTGYDRTDAIGQTPRLLQSGEHNETFYEEIWETLLEGEVWEGELTNTRKDGDQYIVEQTVSPVEDDEGNIERFVAVATDITERKRRERELQRSKTRFETLFNQSPDIVVVHDENGVIRRVNDQACDQLGYDREELHGKQLGDVDQSLTPFRLQTIRERLSSEETHRYESILKRKNGSTFPARVHITRLDVGDSERFLTIKRDISDQKERERQLRVLDRVLRHNLRNDMNVIRGRAETIKTTATGEISTSAEQIIDKCEELLNTVEKTQAITEVLVRDSDDIVIELDSIAERIVDTLQEKHPHTKIDLDYPDSESLLVSTPTHFSRGLAELLTNAIIHNDRETPEVGVSITADDDTIHLEVADNGPGLPDAEQSILLDDEEFGPLYHGSGLGLWLVYWLVTQTGGTVTVEANEPRGSVIRIKLPRTKPADVSVTADTH